MFKSCLIALLASATLHAAPGCGEPLKLTRGQTTTVRTIAELERAISSAKTAGLLPDRRAHP